MHLAIVLEHAQCGDLGAFLLARRSAGRRLAEREGLVWFSQVLSAVDYLHRQSIVHRDVKAANIFLTGDGNTKLGDFNLSKLLPCNAKKIIERTCTTPCGTPMYNSPEQWLRLPYTQQVDVWALGCLLYELLAGQPVFIADSMEALHRIIHTCTYNRTALASSSSKVQEIVNSMFCRDPRRRISAAELLKNPLIQEVRRFGFCPEELGGSGLLLLQQVQLTHLRRRNTAVALGPIAEEVQESLESLALNPSHVGHPAHTTTAPKLPSIGKSAHPAQAALRRTKSDRAPPSPTSQARAIMHPDQITLSPRSSGSPAQLSSPALDSLSPAPASPSWDRHRRSILHKSRRNCSMAPSIKPREQSLEGSSEPANPVGGSPLAPPASNLPGGKHAPLSRRSIATPPVFADATAHEGQHARVRDRGGPGALHTVVVPG
jgi:serine/threonine protein kinase